MILLDIFIKIYIIMNYEGTKHGSRAGQANQQGGYVAEEISLKSTSHRIHERGIRDIPAASVSLCARGGRGWKDIGSSRGKRSGDDKVACRIDQSSSKIKQEDGRKYQWNNNRGDKAIPEAVWGVRKNKGRWSLSMNLTA